MLPVPKTTEVIKAVKVKKEKVAAPVNNTDGMVIYADAGARPNPGFGGWGLHGYTYSINVPKKGSGNPTVKLTEDGYVEKKSTVQEITPLSYVDAYGTIDHISNNGGEVRAASEGMAYAARFPIKKLTIFTDSAYVVKGVNEHLVKWKNNDWRKADGIEISNKLNWMNLDTNLANLANKDIQINVQWVKGHNDNQGNTLADKHATIGVLQSAGGVIRSQVETTAADGYWSGPDDRHPFISHRRCYFTTNKKFSTPGEYYLGNHGKDDELLGKRTADGTYAYVILDTPDPYIEVMRAKQLQVSNTEDAIIMARLDKLYELQARTDLLRFGEVVLHKTFPNRLDLHYVDSLTTEPITRELNPPRIAIRAVEAVNALKGILLDWRDNKSTELVSTDLLEHIYEISEKGEYKLKDNFVSGFTDLQITALYSEGKQEKKIDISLVLGLDLPDRNALKKLEKHKPAVTLVTWKESDTTIRYATIIKTNDAIGIWAGYYSNFKFLDTETK